jgi:hypothetical protein
LILVIKVVANCNELELNVLNSTWTVYSLWILNLKLSFGMTWFFKWTLKFLWAFQKHNKDFYYSFRFDIFPRFTFLELSSKCNIFLSFSVIVDYFQIIFFSIDLHIEFKRISHNVKTKKKLMNFDVSTCLNTVKIYSAQ